MALLRRKKEKTMDIPTLEVLQEMRQLLQRGWTQRASARNADGMIVEPENPTATQYCIVGALMAQNVPFDQRAKVFDALYAALPERVLLISYNDAKERRQEDMLALIDTTIKNHNRT